MDNFTSIIETDTGKLVKFADSRAYTRTGLIYYPGISHILDVISRGAFYDKWLMSNGLNAQILAREAMDRGSITHKAIQDLNNGKTIEFESPDGGANYTRDVWIMIDRYMDFYNEFKPEILEVEKVLVSDILGYGSQLDIVIKLKGETIIVDLKTGGVYDSAFLQLAAYRALWNEFYPKQNVNRVAILHLEATTKGRDKQGKNIQGQGWKLEFAEDVEKDYLDFQAVYQIWKRKNPEWKPFNLIYPAKYSIKQADAIECVVQPPSAYV